MAIKLTGNPNSSQVEEIKEVKLDKKGRPIKPKKPFYFGTFLLVLSCIVTGLMGLMAAIPALTVIAAIICAIILMILVLFPTCLTIGLIWFSEDYRNLIESFGAKVEGLFNNSFTETILDFISSSYWYVTIIGGAIVFISLLFSIIAKIKDKQHNGGKTGQMVAMIIISIVFIVAAIFVNFVLKAA